MTDTVSPRIEAPILSSLAAAADSPLPAQDPVPAEDIVVPEPRQAPRRVDKAPKRRYLSAPDRLCHRRSDGEHRSSRTPPCLPLPATLKKRRSQGRLKRTTTDLRRQRRQRPGFCTPNRLDSPDTSRELMAAVEALLESKSPPDPVTRQFVEDAIRAVNESDAASADSRTRPTAPGGPQRRRKAPNSRIWLIASYIRGTVRNPGWCSLLLSEINRFPAIRNPQGAQTTY